jgi:predicted permease
VSNFKFSLRALLKTPGFTLVAVLTIAIGIGANTALFSVFDRLVLNPVRFSDPSSLVAVWSNDPKVGISTPGLSWPRYEEIQRHAQSFSLLAASAGDSFTLTGNGDPVQLSGLRVTPSFFPVLGVPVAQGRNFAPEDDVPNGPAVAVISHELWQTRFGGRPSIIGENILLNGQPWEVIGILPPQLGNPYSQAQIFVPRVFEVSSMLPVHVRTGAGFVQVVGRLKPGASLRQAGSELAAISAGYSGEFRTNLDANYLSEARGFVEALTGKLRPTFVTLLGAVAFVLLIACANVASLFLSRLAARHKEIAVRQSLGATRRMIIGQFLAESLLFSLAAGALGILLAVWCLAAIQSTFAGQLPANTVLSLDWRALAFTGGVSLLSAVLVGLAPAFQASKTQLVEVLKDSARGSSSARSGKFRSGLIVTQVALSVVLLVGSGLLLVSFLRLQDTPPGFEVKGVASAMVSLPGNRYKTGPEQARFFADVVERLKADARVEDAAAAVGLPVSGLNPRSAYSIQGRPILPLPQRPIANLGIVGETYFTTLQIPFKEGRSFTAADNETAPGVAIVNESFANRMFPGESAIGKVIVRGPNADIRHEDQRAPHAGARRNVFSDAPVRAPRHAGRRPNEGGSRSAAIGDPLGCGSRGQGSIRRFLRDDGGAAGAEHGNTAHRGRADGRVRRAGAGARGRGAVLRARVRCHPAHRGNWNPDGPRRAARADRAFGHGRRHEAGSLWHRARPRFGRRSSEGDSGAALRGAAVRPDDLRRRRGPVRRRGNPRVPAPVLARLAHRSAGCTASGLSCCLWRVTAGV